MQIVDSFSTPDPGAVGQFTEVTLTNFARGFVAQPRRFPLGKGYRVAYWPSMGSLAESDMAELYKLISEMARVTFGADVAAYWKDKAHTKYLVRVTQFALIVDSRDVVIGWTGFHRLTIANKRCIYIDSTGILPQYQRGGAMSHLFLLLIVVELLRNCLRSIVISMRTENPVVYYAFYRSLGEDEVFPHLNGCVPAEIQAFARGVAAWLGQDENFDPQTLTLHGAYSNIGVMYGNELPACADQRISDFFRNTMRRQDGLLIVVRCHVLNIILQMIRRRLR
jgi:hypothetical protein